MKTTTMLAALALAATLAGCGGGGGSGATSTPGSPATSAPGGSGSGSSGATPGGAGSPGSAAGANVADPCEVLDAGDIARLTGVEVKKGTPQDVGSSKLCNWLPQDGTTSDAAVFSAQEGPLPGPLSQVEDQLKAQFKGTVTRLSVPGADDARYITGKSSGLNVIDVLAQKDETFYQVLVASPRNTARHKPDAIKIAEALLKG